MSSRVAGASAAAASAARVDVLPTLLLLCAEVAEARRAGGRRRGRAHADIGEGGLVATVGGGLGRDVHRRGEVLLAHGLGELEVVGSDTGHLALHLEVAELLLRLDHAHIDVLLVGCSNLLLLLLEDLNLLCNSKLFHCAIVSARSSVRGQGGHELISGVSSEGLRR